MKLNKNIYRIALCVALTLTACGEDKGSASSKSAKTPIVDQLLGAGATFPYPLYSEMFSNYLKKNGIKVNYQAIGSGGGQRQIKSKTVDFGGSDAFVSDKKLSKFKGDLLHIPMVLGAVSVSYHLETKIDLKLDAETLTNIFLGKITKWNDPAIAQLNTDATLPDQKITVIRRSDGSGTTAIFTDYLSKVSQEWKEKVGKGKSVKWPVGMGQKGNDGITNVLKKTPGAIAYIELAYAIKNNLPVASLKNAAGNFVKPNIEGTSLAAESELPADTRVSLTNSPADQGYPIAGFTWILVYKEQNYSKRPQARAKALVDLLWWMSHEGQRHAQPLHYAPLPAQAQRAAETLLKSMTYDGQTLL